MIIKGIQDEDFVNYKKPSMFISFPSCTWKCEKECGKKVCQNGTLATSPNIEIDVKAIVDRYMNNSITKAIVLGGLEPFDSFQDMCVLIHHFRDRTEDDIVIYTGYNKEEISYAVDWLHLFPNIIVKFGRFIPNQTQHYDEVLGVYLASLNQRGERIS
jgi:organic radical activating enzyme